MITALLRFLPLYLVLAFFAPSASHAANAADIKINLTASTTYPGAKGAAKYRNRSGEREFQVEAEVSRRLVGFVLTVSVNGAPVGQMVIDAFGKGRLALNSKLGDTVPAIVAGSTVRVSDNVGETVVSGAF